jgi:hypothetical protein
MEQSYVSFEGLIALTMKNAIFWEMTGCRLVGLVAEHFEYIVCWLCSHQLLVVHSRTL